MKHLTRITALLLAILMGMTIIPATVFADDLDFSELDIIIEEAQTFLDSIDAEYEEWGYTQYVQANVDALRIIYDEVIAAYPTLNDQTAITNYTVALDDALFTAEKYYDQTEWSCDQLLAKAEELKELDGFNYTYKIIAYQNGTKIINYSYLYATTIDWVNKDTTVVYLTDDELRHTRRHIDERIRQIEQHIAFYNDNHYIGRGADYIDQEIAIELGNIAIEITEGPNGGEYTPMLTAWRNLALNDKTNEYVAEYYSQLTRLSWYYPNTSGYKPLHDILLAMCSNDNRDVFDRWGYWVKCKEKQNYDHGANHDHFTDAYLKIIRIVIVWGANHGYLDINTNFDTTALTAAITRAKAIRDAGYDINPVWPDEYRFEADFNEAINEAEYIIKWPYSLKEAQHAANRLNEYCDRIEGQTAPADYTELIAMLNTALAIDKSLYTADSVQVLNNAIIKAQNAIAANYTVADQWRIDRIVVMLQSAINNLVSLYGDPTALHNIYQEATPFYEAGMIGIANNSPIYRENFWNNFSTAYNTAANLLDGQHEQDEYNTCASQLHDALQPIKLNCKLYEAQQINPMLYTTASYMELNAAIQNAEQDLNTWALLYAGCLAEEVPSYNQIQQSIEQLILAGSPAALLDAIAAVTEFMLTVNENNYTPTSWATLVNALTEAQNLVANPNMRYEQNIYDEAATALDTAFNNLVLQPQGLDLTALENAVTAASNIQAIDYDKSGLNAQIWNTFTAAYSAAYDMLYNTPAGLTQQQVNTTAAALVNALENLNSIYLDRSGLQAKIEAAQSIDESLYTMASIIELHAILDDAIALMTQDTTASTIADFIQALDDALASLVIKLTDETTEQINTILIEIASLNAADYSGDSWDNLTVAVQNATALLALGDNATQANGEIVLEQLETALAALSPYEAPFLFDDVQNERKYYYKAVYWAYNHGITAGTNATHFSPDNACTRGQIVTFLWRATGSQEPTITTCPFTDVPTKKYYYKPVLWALENHITAGVTANHFEPNTVCTRAMVVSFLWRIAGSPEPDLNNNPFTDVLAKKYYYKAVLWAYQNGITSGTNANKFSPDVECNRAMVVTFLYKMNETGIIHVGD